MSQSKEAGTRYIELTEDNQSANIWVVALISVAIATACLGTRLVSKTRMGFKFATDDWVFLAGWAIQCVQVGLTIKALVLGLGQDSSLIDPANIESIRSYTAAATVLITVSIYFVKVSLVLLIGRLFAQRLLYFWLGISVIGIAAAVEIQAGCVYPSCSNLQVRVIVAVAFDIITELVIMAIPIYCIQPLRMPQVRKLKVLASFCSRCFVILFAALYLWGATHIRDTGTFTTSIVRPYMFYQLELGLSLCICAIIPCFRMIFQSSDLVLTDSDISQATKSEVGDGNARGVQPNRLRNFVGRSNGSSSNDTSTQISYVRRPIPIPPVVPEKKQPHETHHSAKSSRDMASHSTEGRISESSQVPSTKPLVHGTGIAL